MCENYLNRWRDLPVSLLLAIHFLSNGCEKLLDAIPSANYLCTHLIECQLSDYEHRLPSEQILTWFKNKFWIIIRNSSLLHVRLGERTFHTKWHQRYKYKIYFGLSSRIIAKESYFAWLSNIPNRAFPEIMSLDELSMQNTWMLSH